MLHAGLWCFSSLAASPCAIWTQRTDVGCFRKPGSCTKALHTLLTTCEGFKTNTADKHIHTHKKERTMNWWSTGGKNCMAHSRNRNVLLQPVMYTERIPGADLTAAQSFTAAARLAVTQVKACQLTSLPRSILTPLLRASGCSSVITNINRPVRPWWLRAVGCLTFSKREFNEL